MARRRPRVKIPSQEAACELGVDRLRNRDGRGAARPSPIASPAGELRPQEGAGGRTPRASPIDPGPCAPVAMVVVLPRIAFEFALLVRHRRAGEAGLSSP